MSPSPSDSPLIPTRSPVLHWLLTVFTGGIYAYVWIYRMMGDVNRLCHEERIPVKKLVRGFVPLAAIYPLGFVFAVLQPPEAPTAAQLLHLALFAVATVLAYLIFYSLVRISAELRTLGLKSAPSALVVIVTTLFYLISLPILQDRLNKISIALREGPGPGN